MKLFHFHKANLKKGIAFVVFAWFCFSCGFAIAKLLGDQTTVPTLLFVRCLVGTLALTPWMIAKWPKSLYIQQKGAVFIRCLVGFAAFGFIFLAIERISLVNATLLNNSAPFFVPFFVWIYFKKVMDWKLWPAILVGFIGIALILRPTDKIFNWGATFALFSGMCLAISSIVLRKSSHKENPTAYLFYYYFFGVVAAIPFLFFSWKIENFTTLLGLIAIGLFSVLGQYFLFHGFKHGKAHQLAPLSYATVLFAGIFEWIFWAEIPPPIAYVGAILIIASGVWIAWTGRLTRRD